MRLLSLLSSVPVPGSFFLETLVSGCDNRSGKRRRDNYQKTTVKYLPGAVSSPSVQSGAIFPQCDGGRRCLCGAMRGVPVCTGSWGGGRPGRR